jgi:Ca2+-binding EF-hand superfamily protein
VSVPDGNPAHCCLALEADDAMESKTMLLDLVQQRKDGKISQEEMVRQLVELRNHVRTPTAHPHPPPPPHDVALSRRFTPPAHPNQIVGCAAQSGGAAVEPAAAPTKASAPQSPPGEQGTVGGESLATAQQQRPVLEADIARQRQQRLAAKQFRGIVAAPRVEEPAGPATQYGQGRGAEEAAALARTFHAAVNSQGRDWRDVFNEYDLGKEGRLDFDDFRRGVRNDMSAAQSALTDLDLRRLFDMMDDSHSESVSAADFSNFLSSMSPQSNGRAEQQRRFTYPHNANTIALRDKFCAVAIGHDRSVDWKSLLERFSPDGDGYITFVEFSRAVRRDRKVTRAAMSDRELRQLFDIVDVRQRDKISAEGLEYFLQQPARALRKQQTKKQSCRNARPRADHSQGWDGTSEGSEISEFALSSQQSSLSGEPSFQKGPRVARKLKKQEDANCTFTPEIKELPSQYSKGNSVVADAPFSARAGQWLEKRKDKLNSERRLAKSRETAGCTFHPRLSPSTHAKQRQARSGRSREEKFERLYSEKLGRDEAKMKKAQQLEGRTDGGKWFKPKINDSASSQPDNYAKPVVRKVGAVTQQLLNERESQHTFTPKTNAVPSKFGCAAEYLSDNAFDRLSRPTRSDGMDDSAELSTGERLFDSVYDFGQEPQRTQRARPSSAPRLRTVPSHGDNASESDSVASSRFE